METVQLILIFLSILINIAAATLVFYLPLGEETYKTAKKLSTIALAPLLLAIVLLIIEQIPNFL